MSWESTDFREMFPSTVTVLARTGRNSDGSDTFSGTASTYRARVKNIIRQVRDAQGNVAMAGYEVWVASTSVIAADSKITIPHGSTTRTPPILSVTSPPDDDGLHHCKVICGY